jgi:hypothetical protein
VHHFNGELDHPRILTNIRYNEKAIEAGEKNVGRNLKNSLV